MTKEYLKPWTVHQLYQAMQRDLERAQSSFERSMIKAVCGKEIRSKAIEWSFVRKLTPGEISIAQQFGYTA